jgi:hypothetical protein
VNAGENGGTKYLLVIEVGEGARGLVTGNRGELEIVLPRGQKLRLLSVRKAKGFRILHLRTA